jgi:hypothetical protein
MAEPFKSAAQQKKWQELVATGKVTQVQYDAKQAASQDVTLPERASPRRRTVGPSRAPAQAKLTGLNGRY